MKLVTISYISISITLSLLLFSCAQNIEDDLFEEKISIIENNPYSIIFKLDSCQTSKIVNEKEATNFLLKSLAKNYINSNDYPQKEKLELCLKIFTKKRKAQKQLETLNLFAAIYKNEGDLANEVKTIKDALVIAHEIQDKTRLFQFYSYLSDMYIRKFDLLKFIKYQAIANQYLQDINIKESNVHTKLLIAKSLLYSEQYNKAVDLLYPISQSISQNHAYYNNCKRLLGISYFKLRQWEPCINIILEVLNQDNSTNNKFTYYSTLTYCYYSIGDLPKAQKYKKLAISSKKESDKIRYNEIEFYKLCAKFAKANQNIQEEIECLDKVIDIYKQVVQELNGGTLYEAIQSYARMNEQKEHEQQVKIYQYCALCLILILAIITIMYINKKKRHAYELLSLQQQISALEGLSKMQEQTKSFVLRDFEVAQKIAVLKHTQKELGSKLVKELDRFNLIKENPLLTTQWDKFYHYIDLTFDNFYSKITKSYPILNEKEVQLCCMLIAGFKTEEIAAIWMKSVFSVHKYKTNIRKKIDAPEASNIITFLTEKSLLQ